MTHKFTYKQTKQMIKYNSDIDKVDVVEGIVLKKALSPEEVLEIQNNTKKSIERKNKEKSIEIERKRKIEEEQKEQRLEKIVHDLLPQFLDLFNNAVLSFSNLKTNAICIDLTKDILKINSKDDVNFYEDNTYAIVKKLVNTTLYVNPGYVMLSVENNYYGRPYGVCQIVFTIKPVPIKPIKCLIM